MKNKKVCYCSLANVALHLYIDRLEEEIEDLKARERPVMKEEDMR